ncbi:MAG: hypothetical protein VW262_09110 [Flavobacteriaceae bacterium]
MTFKKDYIEICLTTEDGIQHLRCHGWLKRNQYLVKSEQVFRKGGEDFGMFIIVVPNKELVNIMEYEKDMFTSFEVLSKENERWDTYKKIKDRDFVENISNFMFSLAPENKIDIDTFIEKTNEATLKMFKTSNEFRADYVWSNFMSIEEKMNDLDVLITFFEERERYEDCAYLLKIRDKIVANEEFKSK